MSKIICAKIDFAFIDEVEKTDCQKIPKLKDGKDWKKINVIENPVYRFDIKQNDPGPTKEETVSAKARHNNLIQPLIDLCGFHVILRLYTDDDSTFFVGSPDYPATIEVASDRIFDNFTFKAVSPG